MAKNTPIFSFKKKQPLFFQCPLESHLGEDNRISIAIPIGMLNKNSLTLNTGVGKGVPYCSSA